MGEFGATYYSDNICKNDVHISSSVHRLKDSLTRITEAVLATNGGTKTLKHFKIRLNFIDTSPELAGINMCETNTAVM